MATQNDLAGAMAKFTIGLRQIVMTVGHQRAAEICYHAGDNVIAEGHRHHRLPPIKNYRRKDDDEGGVSRPVLWAILLSPYALVALGMFIGWRLAQ